MICIGGGAAEGFVEIVGKPAREVKRGLLRRIAIRDGAFPSDLNTRKKVSFGADGLEESSGFEAVVAEDLGIRVEGHGGAPSVGRGADLFNWAQRQAPREALFK